MMEAQYDETTEDRRSVIKQGFDELGDQIQKLKAQVQELAKRLDPIVLPSEPSPPMSDKPAMAVVDRRSPLRSRIDTQLIEVRDVQRTLASLADRLEV